MFAISVPPLSTMYTPFKPPKPIPFTPPYHLVNWWCCCCYCCFFVVKDIDIFFLLTVCSVAFLCTLLSLFNGFYTYFFLPAIVVGSIALRHFHCSLRLKAAFRLYVVVVVVGTVCTCFWYKQANCNKNARNLWSTGIHTFCLVWFIRDFCSPCFPAAQFMPVYMVNFCCFSQ